MLRRLLASLPLVMLAISAEAATIYISPGLVPPADGSLDCHVVNGDPLKPIEYVLQMFNVIGVVVFNAGGSATTQDPLTSLISSTQDNTARFCVVTLTKGSKTKVRVSVSIQDSTGTTISALEAHP